MKLTYKKVYLLLWLFFGVALTGLLSCKSYLTYEGQEVAGEDRIEIKEGGPNKGFWQTRDLSVSYAYHKTASDFILSGEISFAGHLMYNFEYLDSFHLRVYFIDGNGRIIEGKGLFYSGYKVSIENMSFKKHLTLPSGAVAMVFSYTGSAFEQGDDEGQTDYEFWKSPVRRRLFN